MNTYRIHSFSEFNEFVQKLPNGPIYRGVSKSAYELIPSIGRTASSKMNALETAMFTFFKIRAPLFIDFKPEMSGSGWH